MKNVNFDIFGSVAIKRMSFCTILRLGRRIKNSSIPLAPKRRIWSRKSYKTEF